MFVWQAPLAVLSIADLENTGQPGINLSGRIWTGMGMKPCGCWRLVDEQDGFPCVARIDRDMRATVHFAGDKQSMPMGGERETGSDLRKGLSETGYSSGLVADGVGTKSSLLRGEHGRTAVETRIRMTGMTCMHCVAAVTQVLQKVSGVQSADVNLQNQQAVVM